MDIPDWKSGHLKTSLIMKNKKEKFDAVKLMRNLREMVNKEISNLTPEQVVEYFKKHRLQFEKEMAGR